MPSPDDKPFPFVCLWVPSAALLLPVSASPLDLTRGPRAQLCLAGSWALVISLLRRHPVATTQASPSLRDSGSERTTRGQQLARFRTQQGSGWVLLGAAPSPFLPPPWRNRWGTASNGHVGPVSWASGSRDQPAPCHTPPAPPWRRLCAVSGGAAHR